MSPLSPEEFPEEGPFAPKIVKKLPEKTISQDKQMVKFEVKVVGHPKPETKWTKAGEELTASDEFQIENLEDGTSILIINDVYPDDTGEIKFEAFNAVGVAETITEFVVEGNFKQPERLLNFFFIIFENFSKRKKDLQQSYLSPCHTFYVHTKLLI
jgi:Immunoglobulin I-set domain